MEAAWRRSLLRALLLSGSMILDTEYCLLSLGGLLFQYELQDPETSALLKGFIEKNESGLPAGTICVTSEYMEENHWLVGDEETSAAFLEFQSLMLATGNALLSHKSALFHGAAMLWNGLAWIFTAPSGTGKTTQLRLWRKLFRKDVQVINGDKPVLECREDGSVRVCCSPWRGKEKLGHQDLHAPLGGIVLLEQGAQNHMERLSMADAVLPLFTEFVSFPENEEQIRCQAEILTRILDAVPVWKLTNLGDEASALLTQKTLSIYLEEQHDKR